MSAAAEDTSDVATRLDIIGDIHGELGALRRLGHKLGYDVDADWHHPEHRRLVFIGDLVDRGPRSLEVAELVQRLCEGGSAICLMGNHELNMIEWRRGRAKPKPSNRDTIADAERRKKRWKPVLDFFESLPLALELPDLRVTHAVWHLGCFEQLRDALTSESSKHPVAAEWRPYVALHTPFEDGELRRGIPTEPFPGQSEKSLEIFLKGHELPAPEPFVDNDGKERTLIRAQWWEPQHNDVPKDKRIVFGHYWNRPPTPSEDYSFVPPAPSGHPELRRLLSIYHDSVRSTGTLEVPDDVHAVCIDFNGLTSVGKRACVGAYRYPEAEITWAALGSVMDREWMEEHDPTMCDNPYCFNEHCWICGRHESERCKACDACKGKAGWFVAVNCDVCAKTGCRRTDMEELWAAQQAGRA